MTAPTAPAATPAPDKTERRLRKGTMIVVILAVVGVLMGFVSWGGNAKPKNDKTPVPNAAVINALTVKTVNVDCSTLVKTVKDGKATLVVYDVGALKSVPPRKWSDALSTPLGGNSPPGKLKSQKAAVCNDPELGVSVANMFANLNVGGVNVGDLNPWLSPYKGSATQVNDKAAEFIPLLDVSNPSKAQSQNAVQKNVEYQALAARLDTLIGRFSLLGVKSMKSSQNWHLVAGGLAVGGLPEVGLNPNQENLPALILQVTEKGACAPLKVIGFNVGDKRPEVFPTPTCKSPQHKQGKVPSTPTTPNAPRTTPTVPGNTPSTPRSTAPSTSHTTPSTPPPSTPTRTSKNGDPTGQPTQHSSGTGPLPSPVPVTDSNGSVWPTSSTCVYDSNGSAAPGPGDGITCS
ncbi:MAG: hypothetical protein WC498_00640 [Candidatus Saccharimonadales bacterium]